MKMDLTSCSDQNLGVLWGLAKHQREKGVPVLDTHEVVEDGIECSREGVEEAREIHEILIDSPVDMAMQIMEEHNKTLLTQNMLN